jgi:hypothetical protein
MKITLTKTRPTEPGDYLMVITPTFNPTAIVVYEDETIWASGKQIGIAKSIKRFYPDALFSEKIEIGVSK